MIGIVLCLMAAFLAVLNFTRPTSTTIKLIPLILFVLGVRQLIRARTMAPRQSRPNDSD
jgi:membrane-bound ClpP family serine protease